MTLVGNRLQILALGLLLVQGAAANALGRGASGTSHGYQAWRSEAARVLAVKADANSLATAAALTFGETPDPPRPTALDLIARASELAPENSGISWLHLQLCNGTPQCDSRGAAMVLRWVDPDNAAAWLSQLGTAQRDADAIEMDRVLADMAHGTRFDLYFNRIVVLMYDALSSVRHESPGSFPGSDSTRLAALLAIAGTEIIPPLAPLMDACREPVPGSERREDCLKLSKIMQKGDTIVVQLAGFGIEKRLRPVDSKEVRNLLERRNLLEWRVSAAGKLDYSILPWTVNSRARARLAQMRLRPREEDVCMALLRNHKVVSEPVENHR